ncbi:hypothetical protein DFQ01_14227 [Paenibacillus cellulosilyticus]|uniref:Glycosyl transferase family 8 n=1 Tax=Paenibacillus cellulosilyticus TaxID=375489 RepID=A0A2V2YEG7_9BACL|nr:hypothetical protein [Paenibacillus cellulosilyticus]PWV90579.1 hypothetical protein DFQ01_14227 [Paenibacillus cellulosilyticus]QKS46781.1 hypothetical protein HUB94_19985 [Paenibacillus cellulosilyticus]
MIIGTVVTKNNLAQAKVLAQSIKRFNPDVRFVVSLLERYTDQDHTEYPFFDKVVLASKTWQGNFDQVIFKYSAREASCFAKALLIDYIFTHYPNEQQVLYLDHGMEVLAPLRDLRSRLEQCSVLLTPQHLYTGAESHDVGNGAYHSGLIAVSRTTSGLGFVQWWIKRLERYSFMENDRAPQTPVEPKWLDLVPGLFEGVEVLKHPGYNVASGNYDEREITQAGYSHFRANGETLYIKHFDRIGEQERNANDPEYAKQHPALATLIKQYTARLDGFGWDRSYSAPWSYQFYNSGEPINSSIRLIYRNNLFLEQKYPDPYKLSNEFFEWGIFGEEPPAVMAEPEPSLDQSAIRPSLVRQRRKKPQSRSMIKREKKVRLHNRNKHSRMASTATVKLLHARARRSGASKKIISRSYTVSHKHARPFGNLTALYRGSVKSR